MNFKNKKTILFLTVFVMLLVGLSVASATNVTKTSDKVSKKSVDTSKAVKNFVVDKKVVKNTTKESIKTATSKTKTKITISNVKKQYEVKDQLQVKAKLTDNKNKALKNQYVTINVNKNSYKVKTDKKGVATTKKITLNNVGKYTIMANFAGTKKYASSKVTKATKSTKMSMKLVAENYLEYSKNQHENITFFLCNKKGNKVNKKSGIDVIINNKNKKIKMEKGRIVLTLNNSKLNGVKLNNGTNNLTFKYTGDKTTKKVVKKFRFIINRTQPEIMMDVPKTINFGVIESFEPQILEPNYHHFKVIIDGKAYDARDGWYDDYWRDDNGPEFDLPIPVNYLANKTGKHSIYVKFAGDYEYAPTKTDVSYFNVVRAPSVLSLDLKNKNNVNETMYIKANLEYKEARWGQRYPTGEVINFTINNKTYQRKTVNGTATLKYTPKKVGNYTIKIKLNTSDSKNVTLNKTNKKFVVGKNIVKKPTKFEVEYKKSIIKGRSQKINITLLYKPNQYLDIWKTMKKAKIFVKTNTTEKEYETNKKGQISIENQGENFSIIYKGNSSILKNTQQMTISVHDKAKFNITVRYQELIYDDILDELYENNVPSLLELLDCFGSDESSSDIEIEFINKNDFILNSANVSMYLDDNLIDSVTVKDNKCRFNIYGDYGGSVNGNIEQLVEKYYYKKDFEVYVDKENSNITYKHYEIYKALLSKFSKVNFVFNNKDVSNLTITQLVNGTSEQNIIKQSFETKDVF